MSTAREHFPLGYSNQWIALRIVSAADIHRDLQASVCGDDPHPEH